MSAPPQKCVGLKDARRVPLVYEGPAAEVRRFKGREASTGDVHLQRDLTQGGIESTSFQCRNIESLQKESEILDEG